MKQSLLLLCITLTLLAAPIKVTFVNPGSIDDPFFSRLCDVMEAAANDLNISLEILYSGRDYINGVEIGKEILDRKNRPDFLLLINEDGMAEQLIIEAKDRNVPCVLFNEGFSDQFKKSYTDIHRAFPNLVTQVLPNDSLAGYILAQELIKTVLPQKPNPNLLALTGSPRTSSSLLRQRGLMQALKEYPQVTLLQVIPAHWKKDKATYVTQQAFKRYATIDIIWSASDLMALGALSVDKVHDQEIKIGGVDWATFAFKEVKRKRFTTTVGGHFFDGAWALVLIHDYVKSGKLSQKKYLSNSFHAVTSTNIKSYISLLMNNNWDYIDFKKYSMFYNKAIKTYDFSLKEIFKKHDKVN